MTVVVSMPTQPNEFVSYTVYVVVILGAVTTGFVDVLSFKPSPGDHQTLPPDGLVGAAPKVTLKFAKVDSVGPASGTGNGFDVTEIVSLEEQVLFVPIRTYCVVPIGGFTVTVAVFPITGPGGFGTCTHCTFVPAFTTPFNVSELIPQPVVSFPAFTVIVTVGLTVKFAVSVQFFRSVTTRVYVPVGMFARLAVVAVDPPLHCQV
jgi:hypothetical protein